MSQIIEYVKNFCKKFKWHICSAAIILLFSVIFKKRIYNKMIPISDYQFLLRQGAFKKVVVGSIFLLCYFKSPSEGMQYCLANRSLLAEEEVANALKASDVTYSSPILNESHIAYGIILGFYSYFCYKLVINL